MRKIFKYELTSERCQIWTSAYNTILSAGEQDGKIFVWINIDDAQELKVGFFYYIFATGQTLPDNINKMVFVDTVQMKNGLVFHIFKHYE